MALSPQITACIVEGCTKLRIYDTTGVYNATTNTGGWGAPNIAGSAVTSAIITYTIGDNDPVNVDYTSEIPATITGDYAFTDIDVETEYTDGEVEITYTIVSPAGTYTKTVCLFFTCQAECCLSNMWATIATLATTDCNCDLKSKVEDAIFAEGLLYAAKSAASCNGTALQESILEKIQRLCNFEDCDCD